MEGVDPPCPELGVAAAALRESFSSEREVGAAAREKHTVGAMSVAADTGLVAGSRFLLANSMIRLTI